MSVAPTQLQLFAAVAATFADAPDGRLANAQLYDAVADRAKVPQRVRSVREAIGLSGQKHNVFERTVRWHQQTLKGMGVIRHTEGERGVWELANKTPKGLHQVIPGARIVAFSTSLGVAIWGDCAETFAKLDAPIALCVTSPPYLLAKPRAYGNPAESDYVDFLVSSLKPIVDHLLPGGSICLNLGQDSFIAGSPARSMVNERVLLALHDKLGLQLMDRLVWNNPSRIPGPVQWASKTRVQLNASYEFIYWLSPSPHLIRSNNRRVLLPHSDKHRKLMAAGGEKRDVFYGDGAYHLRPGSFANPTPGKIPRNVITQGTRCADTLQYRRDAAALRLPMHGAVMPLRIPDFLIRFLTEPGDLVADPFGGTCTTGAAAERLGRRWIVTEQVLDYLRPSAERFRQCEGFEIPAGVESWPRAA